LADLITLTTFLSALLPVAELTLVVLGAMLSARLALTLVFLTTTVDAMLSAWLS